MESNHIDSLYFDEWVHLYIYGGLPWIEQSPSFIGIKTIGTMFRVLDDNGNKLLSAAEFSKGMISVLWLLVSKHRLLLFIVANAYELDLFSKRFMIVIVLADECGLYV